MRATRIADLAALAATALIAAWLLARGFPATLPPLRWYIGGSLYPVAVIEAVLAVSVARSIKEQRVGLGPSQWQPITIARILALAKASSLIGAAFAGAWAGLMLALAPDVGTIRAATEDFPATIVGLLGGLFLAAAAWWLERACRAPDDPEDDDDPDPRS
ncbi:DUF3180 domain-containing protein [Hoyosella sp. G463]|uniref:DUF3180 domain-containing protein n=1 Tax=Lolliginicoccus lacisalsi TaxID=2742202 RepID=A0A927PN62_9ACTN|nr:DUF3180 domain-containing protein [Lolliginicoccus lacisalsi]MBD8507291.1 DUF3180 domain-containing protein [Lolliginicoccus lacisalsi]